MEKIFTKVQAYKHQGKTTLVLALVLGTVGLSTILVSAANQQKPPRPLVNTYANVINPSQSRPLPATFLAPSDPVSLKIPSINVVSEVTSVAKNPDGTVEVPSGRDFDKAAWYKYSPTPGEKGSTVILGHVDSAKTGPSIFFNLSQVRPEDKVMVKRADNTTAVFRIDSIREYSKEAFPTLDVYGPSDGSTLKLITCSGEFDSATQEYENNIVVYASYVESYQN